jgi:hypothetical protein
VLVINPNRSVESVISYLYETMQLGGGDRHSAVSYDGGIERLSADQDCSGGEPVPHSSTLDNAPPAPTLPADWTRQLTERHEAIVSDHLRLHVVRLRPGDDLLGSIRAHVNANHIQAAVLLSAGGS